jgi:hypothetical protein
VLRPNSIGEFYLHLVLVYFVALLLLLIHVML